MGLVAVLVQGVGLVAVIVQGQDGINRVIVMVTGICQKFRAGVLKKSKRLGITLRGTFLVISFVWLQITSL